METRRRYNMHEFLLYTRRVKSKKPGFSEIEEIGHTGKHPIICITLTNNDYDDCSKQHVLLTSMHSGVEYSGANTLFDLVEKLIDGSSESEKYLKEYVIKIIPVVNPYSYEKGGLENQYRTEFSNDPYTDPWTLEGVLNPDLNIEASSVQDVIDRFMPELLIDCHGVFFKNQHMRENTGISVHGMCRPHNEIFPRRMNEAAIELGYHPEYREASQKSPTVLPEYSGRKYQTCFYKINACSYAYFNYHTLAMTMEIGYERSGVARLLKALDMGFEKWPGELYEGFPVNRVLGEGFEGLHPYSDKRDVMRLERTALWNAADNITYGILHPQLPGKETFFLVAPGDEDKLRSASDGRRPLLNQAKDCRLPETPFSISFKIPFRNCKMKKIYISGEPADSEKCTVIKDNGFHMVRVDFPEGANKTISVSIEYDHST